MSSPSVGSMSGNISEFAFNEASLAQAGLEIAKYPEGRQSSAILALLDLAQRQCRGWLPRVAIDYVADYLRMPRMRAYEVATFYSMFHLTPKGRHLVQVCGTTPCWLRGSEDIMRACTRHLGIGVGETTPDGQFSLMEVECLGACANAPMVQINDDYYEDLTPKRVEALLAALQRGEVPPAGPQSTRRCSEPAADDIQDAYKEDAHATGPK